MAGRKPVVIFKMFIAVVALGIIAFFALRSAAPRERENQNLPATGPDTYCTKDSDCWCEIFDGARFYPGKSPSRCNSETNRCEGCFYE